MWQTTVSQTEFVICLEQTVSAAFSLVSSNYMHEARFRGNFGLLFLYNLDKACVIFLSVGSYLVRGLLVGLEKHFITSPVISNNISE